MFENFARSMSDPAEHVIEINPNNDANPLPHPTRGLPVNTEGLVMVTTAGAQPTYLYIVYGAPYPIRVVKVWATGTTAQGTRGLW